MSLIDEQIKDAMRKGEFDDLPGKGKPLKLDDDPYTPEHMRMAYKLLRDNDLVPDWMVQSRELDTLRDKLVVDARRLAHASPHSPALAALHEAAKKYNRQVLSYNLKVPKGVVHKRYLDLEQELAKAR